MSRWPFGVEQLIFLKNVSSSQDSRRWILSRWPLLFQIMTSNKTAFPRITWKMVIQIKYVFVESSSSALFLLQHNKRQNKLLQTSVALVSWGCCTCLVGIVLGFPAEAFSSGLWILDVVAGLDGGSRNVAELGPGFISTRINKTWCKSIFVFQIKSWVRILIFF